MKFCKLILITLLLICITGLACYADRLYIWTDDKGETHISQNAPPPNAVLKDIMDYKSHTRKPEQKTKPKRTPVVTTKTTGVTGNNLKPDSLSGEKTCILYASAGKVSVTVWDYDSVGNRQGVIFRGRLEKGERQGISSYTGIIVFSYQPYGDSKSYGDNRETCEKGNTINVP